MSKKDHPQLKQKQLSIITINDYYLNQFKLKQSMEHTRRCQYFYDKISEEVQEYYLIISQLPQKLEPSLLEERKETHQLLSTYRNYVRDFFEIFRMISTFQISGISKIRSSISDFISDNFEDFKRKIEMYSKEQGDFQQIKVKYNNFMLQIIKMSESLEKILKRPEENYNLVFIKSNSENIEKILQKKQALQVMLNKKYQKIQQYCEQYERLLAFHRHRLVSFKYEYIQKINRFCINSKQSLMQIAGYLYQYINQNTDIFHISKKEMELTQKIRISKDRNQVIEMIQRYGRRYNQQMDLIIETTQTVIKMLTDASKQVKIDKSRQNLIIEDMQKYFIYNQCNISQIVETMTLYRTLLCYLSELGDKLIFLEANLVQLRNTISKYKEILLSIVKCDIEDRPMITSKEPRNKSIQEGIDNYLEQMNEVYIKNILQKIVRSFEETVNKIRNHFLLNQPLKRIIQNSMEISVIETARQLQKRPFKQDIWLWKEWKKQEVIFFPNFQHLDKLKHQMKKIVQLSQATDQEIQTFNCIFTNKKLKGVLILKTQSLLFEATSNSNIFYIPFIKIDNIDIDLSIMNNSLNIQTYSGMLSFTCEQVKDLKRFYLSAQKSIDSFSQSNQQQLKITKYQIPQQQLLIIKKRRQQIKSQLQNLNEYEHFNTIVLHDVEIQDCYRVLVSDNKINVKGKQYECFVHSLMKKFNNTNCIFSNFNPSGPAFYTGNKAINFKNTPLFSERVIEYDHKLPKLPFMPETCHNRQTVRVYWISNEQFQVREENKTSGAPYTEDFSLTFCTIYEKILQGVQVRFFHKITIHRQFSLQKMVISKAMEEAKWGNTILTQEMKKIMMGYKRKTSINSVQKQLQLSNFSDKTRVKEFKDKIKSLQRNNKILIIVLGVILIVNIILRFFV